jgi:hypothetical protein
MLTAESQFHISTPLRIESLPPVAGGKRLIHWTSDTWFKCSEIAGSTQDSPQQPTMLVVKPEGGPALSMKPRQKSCVRSSGIITLSARRPSDGSGRNLPQTCHNDQSGWGHQCSETALTGESRFHISTPLGIELLHPVAGSKRLVHWTSETWCECSGIAGSTIYLFPFYYISFVISVNFLLPFFVNYLYLVFFYLT